MVNWDGRKASSISMKHVDYILCEHWKERTSVSSGTTFKILPEVFLLQWIGKWIIKLFHKNKRLEDDSVPCQFKYCNNRAYNARPTKSIWLLLHGIMHLKLILCCSIKGKDIGWIIIGKIPNKWLFI